MRYRTTVHPVGEIFHVPGPGWVLRRTHLDAGSHRIIALWVHIE